MKTPRNSRLRLNSRLWLVVTALAGLMQLLEPYRGWLILLSGLGGTLLVSYLWARSLAHSLQLQREVRYGWAQVGDRLEERFTLINTSPLPALWVAVVDCSTMPGYEVSQVRNVNWQSHTRWQTEGICIRRGAFQIGPTTLTTSDPFGLFEVEIFEPAAAPILVTPPVIPLPAIEVAPGGRAGEGRPRRDAPERIVSAGGVRAYTPGDGLRMIHWPTSARQRELYVRLFDGAPAGDWWICVDFEGAVQEGSGGDSTGEHAVILAASLADRGLRLGRAVGLVANGAPPVWLQPQMGESQRWKVLHSLAHLDYGRQPVGELLARLAGRARHRSSLILITPSASGEWLSALLPLIWRGVVPTVLALDPVSYGGRRDMRPLFALLSEWGVAGHAIGRELIDRPEARPGSAGRWEWKVSPSGKAVAVQRPRDHSWRQLG